MVVTSPTGGRVDFPCTMVRTVLKLTAPLCAANFTASYFILAPVQAESLSGEVTSGFAAAHRPIRLHRLLHSAVYSGHLCKVLIASLSWKNLEEHTFKLRPCVQKHKNLLWQAISRVGLSMCGYMSLLGKKSKRVKKGGSEGGKVRNKVREKMQQTAAGASGSPPGCAPSQGLLCSVGHQSPMLPRFPSDLFHLPLDRTWVPETTLPLKLWARTPPFPS